MTFDFPKKVDRRRRPIIRDRRGLPAKQVSLQHAGRRFGLLMHWAQRNGICVITEAGKPVLVLIALNHDEALTGLIYSTIAVTDARRQPWRCLHPGRRGARLARARTGGWRRRFGAWRASGPWTCSPSTKVWKRC